jgi:hypothetical protein
MRTGKGSRNKPAQQWLELIANFDRLVVNKGKFTVTKNMSQLTWIGLSSALHGAGEAGGESEECCNKEQVKSAKSEKFEKFELYVMCAKIWELKSVR